MASIKLSLTSKDAFVITGGAEIESSSGQVSITNFAGTSAALVSRFSLPRSPAVGQGSNLQSLAFCYQIESGNAVSFTPSLTREVYIDGAIVSVTSVPMNAPTPAFGLVGAGAAVYRPTMAITTPSYDNQAASQTIVYVFSLGINIAANPLENKYPTRIIINALEISYLFNDSGSAPSSVTSQNVFVSKAGNDTTANGSSLMPFLTIAAAMTSITDATPTKRYCINVGPGTFTEFIILKANVFIVGASRETTRIDGTISVNHLSWAVAGDNRSGFATCSLVGAASTINMVTQSATDGKFYLDGCNVTNDLLFVAFSNNNQARITNTIFFTGTIGQTGFNVQMMSSTLLSGTTVNVSPGTGLNAVLLISNSSGNNNFSIVQPIGAGLITADFIGYSGTSGTLSIDGLGVTANLVSTSFTANNTPTVLNGAALNYGNSAKGVGYTPAVTGNWTGADPTTVQAALDRIAAALGPIA